MTLRQASMPPEPRDDVPPADPISPVGEAFTWVSRITAVGLGMTLPAVAGSWLDQRLGTGLFGPAGLVLGLASALFWIVRLPRSQPARRRRPPAGEAPE